MSKLTLAKTIGLGVTLGASLIGLGVLWFLGDRVDPVHKRGIHATVILALILLAVQLGSFYLR